jgi:Putative beta-barrel porin-2, OmpL-like. bbp2
MSMVACRLRILTIAGAALVSSAVAPLAAHADDSVAAKAAANNAADAAPATSNPVTAPHVAAPAISREGANPAPPGALPEEPPSTKQANSEPSGFADFPRVLDDILTPDESSANSTATTDATTDSPSVSPDRAAGPTSSSADNLYPQGPASSTSGQGGSTGSGNVLTGNFFHRLAQFYQQDWAGTNPTRPTPTKRGLAAPLDSTPFPSSDWGYGGATDMGAPDGNTYPLMSALGLENSRTKIYGWVAASINFSTSAHNNFPVSYDIFPNKIELNQAVVYIERVPDTVQNDHFDWGYHITGFYGIDYRFTTAQDYFSQQLLKFNRQYGFDPVLEYVDLYFPVMDGLNFRIGRFLSVPGIEAQLAPNNYNMTHSLLYTIDPFTDTGIFGSLKLNKQWMIQLGISAGHDVAPWSDDTRPSGIFCLNYSTASNNDNFYGCANGINSGNYAYNNLQDYDFTWYHKFNSKWHMATETWYMYERNVPNVAGNVAHPVPTILGANGAFCATGQLRCTAPEYSIVNYVNRELNSKLMVGFRSDFLDDKKGQRTGIPTKYTENTLYFTKYIGSTVMFRPELRFDHSWDLPGYNNGKARNQLFFGIDMIYKF